jgi:predicted ATPase/class 3 adenylate cyclase
MTEGAPTGIITLMFTDIEDSTALWERMGERFRPVLDRHNERIRALISQWEGYEVKSQGDSFMVAFGRGTDAVQCALEIQRELAAQAWPPEVGELKVRIGMHAGEPFLGYDAAGRADYFGPMVNRAARLAAAGHGGQILLSAATRDIVHGALAADVTLTDLGQHRLRGLEQSEHLFEVRHPGLLPRSFPPLRTLDTLRTNLPVHLTTFVGREKELADLRELLSKPETRLLTIAGPTGAGKTRLSHEVAAACAAGFADGVWLVNLAETSDPGSVVPELAAAVQLALLPNRDAREQLIAFLGEREMLLVLDSFERAIGASLLLSDILKAAPRVKCLLSSQITLRLRGEHVYSVPPMQTPDTDTLTTAELPRFDSVRLFLERARAARADFELTDQNAPHVAEICRQLDGIPLALELASAQVVEMSVAEVLEGLSSRLDSLWSDSPDVPERHRTLRAAIDWSYTLLNTAEQIGLQQLALFAGGCFRESVQAVCGVEGLAALRTLCRHSLVHTAETDEGRTRYLLLEMVRSYARAKLEEQPERAHMAAAQHGDYYVQFAEARVAQIHTRDEARALDELIDELDNLRAALDCAQRTGHGEQCARLALALYEPLHRRGFWEEAQGSLQVGWDAIAAAEGVAPRLRGAIRRGLAVLAFDMGDFAGARQHASDCLALCREANEPPGIAEALNLLGLLAIDAEDLDAAQASLEEGLRLTSKQEHTIRGKILHNLALLASRRGDAPLSRRLYQESLTHFRATGDLRDEAVALGDLGALAQEHEHDCAEARRLYQQSLALRHALRDRWGVAVMLNNLGELAEIDGDVETAIALFTHAERLFRDLHSAFAAVPAEALQRLAERIGTERSEELRVAARRLTWEEAIARAKG